MHQADHTKDRLIIYASYLIGILFLVSGSLLFPQLESVIWINGWHTEFLDAFFPAVTNLGNGLILLPIAVLFLFRKVYLTLALATCALMQAVMVMILKRAIFPTAKRPVHFLDEAAVHFVPTIEVHKVMSFPSGHTVTIFGLCIFLSLCYRNQFLSLFLLILAIAVGLSRVYLLQHFLADVACGAMLGTVAGVLSFHIFEKMSRPLWMENRLEIRFRMTTPRSKSVGY